MTDRPRSDTTLPQASSSWRAETLGSSKQSSDWGIATEVPIEIGFNGNAWTVMMATPVDLEDLALGLAFTEGVIADVGVVSDATVTAYVDGISVDLTVDPREVDTAAPGLRVIEGRTGCGICGIQSLEDLADRSSVQVGEEADVAVEAVEKALAATDSALPLNSETRSVHGALWADSSGNIVAVREDVGRHNALDKLIGHLLQKGIDPKSGFVVMTSRCSYEIVQKTARFGAPLLMTLSAPTSFALDLAARAGVTLMTRGQGGEPVRLTRLEQ